MLRLLRLLTVSRPGRKLCPYAQLLVIDADVPVPGVQGLQLALATLDERVLPTIGAPLRERLAGVRAVIAKVHAAYGEDSAESERVFYEGIRSEADETIGPVSVVSHTGGFSVNLFSAALVKKVELSLRAAP